MDRFSSVVWIFSVHRTELANTRPSYILCKFEPHSFTDEPTVPHLVATGMPNLENVQIRLIGTVDVAAAASKLGHWGSNLVEL